MPSRVYTPAILATRLRALRQPGQCVECWFITIQVNSTNQPNESVDRDDPWLKHLGLFANDPTFEDFLEEVADYRQQADEAEV